MITTLFLILAIITTLSIYIKTKKIKTLSQHQGIRLYNQAFLFFAISYILQFLTSTSSLTIAKLSILQALTSPIQTYLFVVAALYLSASLFWKNKTKNQSQLHIIALLVVILNNFTEILTLTLITIYTYSTIVAYTNYQTKKSTFSQLYLIAIFLLVLANLSSIFYNLYSSYSMTITAFSIFLYGTLKTIPN
ncbi:hypothetical protein J4226_01560 [Candidatus Pacearchaeota archaeon]|nr:hypothetical protein [Candidatus Pacearchaeota archaeon]